jgi:hypothetical protein
MLDETGALKVLFEERFGEMVMAFVKKMVNLPAYSITFYTKGWYCSTMKNICCRNYNSNMSVYGYYQMIINF